MNTGIVTSTDSAYKDNMNSTSELKSIHVSIEQEALPLNKNKPWRIVIRRIVSDGRSGNESL